MWSKQLWPLDWLQTPLWQLFIYKCVKALSLSFNKNLFGYFVYLADAVIGENSNEQWQEMMSDTINIFAHKKWCYCHKLTNLAEHKG